MSVFRPPDTSVGFDFLDVIKFANNIMTLVILGVTAVKQFKANQKAKKAIK